MAIWPFRHGKKSAEIVHPGGSSSMLFLGNLDLAPAQPFDYRRRVGIGIDASVVMAPIQWIQRAMPEAPLVVERQARSGEWEQDSGHELARLLEHPNDGYGGTDLWQATVFSYLTDGNAYWIILRNGLGKPVELWYAPHWLISERFPDDGSQYLTGYTYRVSGREVRLDVADVVHFRHGIDPRNPRRGLSPLDPALREIWSDMEIGEFMATLLRNSGVPGLLLSPEGEGITLTDKDRDEAKEYVRQRTTGAHRGEPLVFSGKTKMERVSWNPKEMDLSAGSDRSEERVCALLGIPAAVVGFSSGLETTKVGATMKEMVRLAWNNGVIPVQRAFADRVGYRLIPAWDKTNRTRLRFDISEVAALQEDANDRAARADKMVRGGWLSVADAKRMMSIEPDPADEIYLRPIAVTAVPVGQDQSASPAPVPAKGVKTAFEERIIATAPHATSGAAEAGYLRIQDRHFPALRDEMARDLRHFFTATLGKRAETAAQPVLEQYLKQSGEDQIIVDRIAEAMAMRDITPIFQQVYERSYLRVATESTAEAMGAIGLATDIADPVARAILATAGRRAGLVDLLKQVKDALFRAIEEGRAEGEGAAQLAARIARIVPAGPWSTTEIRAMVIARTETKHAQRMSTLYMGRSQGVDRYMVFDARLGLTDAECTGLDGLVVPAADADQLASDEHPNGTRDFVPYLEA